MATRGRRPAQALSIIEYSIRLGRPGGSSTVITFYPPDYSRFQLVTYWPTGEIHEVANGQTDTLVATLSALRAEKAAASPPG